MCSASAKCAEGRLGVEGVKVRGERLEVKGTEYAATPLCTAFTLYTLHSTQKQNIKH